MNYVRIDKKKQRKQILPTESDTECYMGWGRGEEVLQTGEERVVIYLVGFKPLAPAKT